MRLSRGTPGHHALRPATIRPSNQSSLQSTSLNPYTLGLSPGALTRRCPCRPGCIAHKVQSLVGYDPKWDPLEMEEGEEIRVHTFTLDEALAATKVDYRCDRETALALWLYAM